MVERSSSGMLARLPSESHSSHDGLFQYCNCSGSKLVRSIIISCLAQDLSGQFAPVGDEQVRPLLQEFLIGPMAARRHREEDQSGLGAGEGSNSIVSIDKIQICIY